MSAVIANSAALALAAVLHAHGATGQTAAPIARYPLVDDLNDATGHHGPLQAANAPLIKGEGLFCNGQYVRETPDGCDVRTPALTDLDFSAFTISARFY